MSGTASARSVRWELYEISSLALECQTDQTYWKGNGRSLVMRFLCKDDDGRGGEGRSLGGEVIEIEGDGADIEGDGADIEGDGADIEGDGADIEGDGADSEGDGADSEG